MENKTKQQNRETKPTQTSAFSQALTTVVASVCAAVLASSCGSVEPSHKKGDVAAAAQNAGSGSTAVAVGSGDAGSGSASAVASGSGAASDDTQVFDLTATYKKRSVDFLIVRSGNTRQGWVDQRIKDAVPTLAARLQFLAPDVNVAVFDNFWILDPKKAPASGTDTRRKAVTSITDAKNPNLVFLNTSMPSADFTTALLDRINNAGARTSPDNNQSTWEPMSLLNAIHDEAAKGANGVLNGLVRKDSFLAVLYLDYNESDDRVEIDDVMTKFADRVGAFAASTLAPEDGGCIYDPAAIPPSETNPNKDPQRNETIRLQTKTNGMWSSICASSYSLFFDDMVVKGTGTEYFSSDLPSAAKPDTIKVSVAGKDVKNFRYWPGTTKIELPSTINSGVKVHITYSPLVPVADAVTTGDNPDPNVPVASEKTLSPEETAFLKDVAPIINNRCGNCHNGRPFNTSGPTIFASAQAYKAEIYDRIQRAANATGVMPQNGWPADATAAANKQALMDYFKP